MPKAYPKQMITIYEPNHIKKMGFKVWGEMARELVQSRGLIWRLIVRDILARYKQSFFGIFWVFFSPLVMLGIFVWVKTKNILPIADTTMPYAAFVFLGQVVWLFFSQGVTTTANSLVSAGSMLTKINFPKEVLVLSSLGQTVFEFLIRMPLLAIVFWWTGFMPNFAVIMLPVVMIPILFLVIGIGFFVSLLNAIFRDIGNILGIILSLGMFVTPVIYPPPQTWPFSFWINFANPVSGYVVAVRDLTTAGFLTHPGSYSFAVILSLLLFLIGWRLMHLVEPKIAERV